jgi:hypothetical protein
VLTVSAASSQTVSPPPSTSFAITGVQTLSCVVVSNGQRRVSFTPRYAGLTGQPVSFSVVNELAPTTQPGPYSLNLYTDNPLITLKASQQGTVGEASFSYAWLQACGSASTRQAAPEATPLRVVVLGNPVSQAQVWVEVQGVPG